MGHVHYMYNEGGESCNSMKPFYESKVLWVNLIGLIVVVAQYAGTIQIINNELLAAILGIANFALRFFTNEPVKLK